MRPPTTDLTLDRFLMKDWADEKGDESENVKGESQRLRFYQRNIAKGTTDPSVEFILSK